MVLVLVVGSAWTAPALAQDDAATETETPSAPPRARRESDPPEDELDSDIHSGPTLAQREAAARRGHPLDRPNYAPDPADLDLPVAVTLSFGGGATLSGSSLIRSSSCEIYRTCVSSFAFMNRSSQH